MPDAILNKLELKPAGHYPMLGLVFDIYIDGVLFLDTLTRFESRFSDTINGAYTTVLGYDDIKGLIQTPGERFMPFACDCGTWECWVFQGFVSTYQDFLYWGSWRNTHRCDPAKKADGLYWNYRDFPTLCFDKAEYLAEMKKARALIHRDKESIKLFNLPSC